MRCLECERSLTAFLKGDLTTKERRITFSHLETCADCRQTAQILRGDFDLDPDPSGSAFVSDVLERTSGSTCKHVQDKLSQFVDGLLDPDSSTLVASHLGMCRECSELFLATNDVVRLLPEMAIVEPDPSFTRDAVETIRSRQVVPERNGPFRRILERMFQRPRFSWEAAYLGTLLIMAIWGGLDTSPVVAQSSRFLASTHAILEASAGNWLEEQNFLGRFEEFHQEMADGYGNWRENVEGLRTRIYDLPEQCEEYLRSTADSAFSPVYGRLERISSKLTWRDSSDEDAFEK